MLEMLVAGANGTCCKLYELQLFSAAITCYKLGCYSAGNILHVKNGEFTA